MKTCVNVSSFAQLAEFFEKEIKNAKFCEKKDLKKSRDRKNFLNASEEGEREMGKFQRNIFRIFFCTFFALAKSRAAFSDDRRVTELINSTA